jgi:transposase
MKVIYERCAGLDVHKKTVVACRIGVGEDSQLRRQETHTFKTMTNDILALADWLEAGGITHVAMESTGAYWKPIYNILESNFEVILVNARHIKHVPGRKTDVKDAEWIAQLLQHGLLKASYIPETPQRALRDLVRYRTKLVQERTREINRVQKVLEDANIKLGSVVSDIMGVSAQAMMAAIVSGQANPQTLAQLAKGRMRPKIAELEQALNGRVADHHRLMLSLHLEHIDDLNSKIERLQQVIDKHIAQFNQKREVERLDGIPGVGPRVAQVIIAELGTDMSRFATSGHAASWAGLAPGKNESAGRNHSAKTMKGNRHLKSMLVQAAHTVARSKDNYLSAQFRRIARRRGKKRAAVAVAHSILVIAYHLLRDGTEYIELGGDYFDKLNKKQLERGLVKRLEQLGHKVVLEPALSP